MNQQFINNHKNLRKLLNNKCVNYAVVNSVLDMISQKGYQKLEARLKKDLPEAEAQLLIQDLNQ